MRALWLTCFTLCALASGCKCVYSFRPLYTVDDAVEDPSLVGEWRSERNRGVALCIEKAEGSSYNLIASSSQSEAESEKPSKLLEIYKVTLVRLDDQLFADMVAGSQLVNGMEVDAPAGAIYHHVIIKLDLNNSELEYSLLDSDAIQEANEQGFAPLPYVDVGDTVLVTASTEELRWAASRYADRLFLEKGERYTKVNDVDAGGSSPAACSPI